MSTAQTESASFPDYMTDESVVSASSRVMEPLRNSDAPAQPADLPHRACRIRSEDKVENVMQQACLNAYLHLHQFNRSARFST